MSRPRNPVPMAEHSLIVHLFVLAHAEQAAAHLRGLWERCGSGLGMTAPIGTIPLQLPSDLGPGTTEGVVAARRDPRRAADVTEAVLHRLHDTYLLSVALAPGDQLEATWARALGDAPWAMGEARLHVAVRPARWPGGRAHTVLKEKPVPPTGRTRTILCATTASRRKRSEAWLWGGGDAPAPFALYLLQAAKVRHLLRLREEADQGIAGLFSRAESLIAERTRQKDDHQALIGIRADLAQLLTGPHHLLQTSIRLREMERSVEIASDNLRRHGGAPITEALLKADLGLAGDLLTRLADDRHFTEAIRERVATSLAELTQVTQEHAREREERLTLLQTAMTGTMLMTLTAVQAFAYKVPLAGSIQPPVIALLGSLALLFATLTLWKRNGSRAAGAVISLIVASVGAALAWLVCSVVAHMAGVGAAPVRVSLLVSAGVSAVTLVVSLLYVSRDKNATESHEPGRAWRAHRAVGQKRSPRRSRRSDGAGRKREDIGGEPAPRASHGAVRAADGGGRSGQPGRQ
ncbi:CATRA conflict system CASPASE/TPR repeat-associated protein [Nonomuraea sp. B10E15]|uniref:CATRA conflict system CASPASE/TPR repeat-associated protein n=1 Tax=Nonomuraea sp. B10E15 TaxID=3153560 RepID=UPI00325E1EF7